MTAMKLWDQDNKYELNGYVEERRPRMAASRFADAADQRCEGESP